jgi:PAS domain S-box-containing protein
MFDKTALVNVGHGSVLPLIAGTAETQFQRLLDNLPAGAYTCDNDGLITYFNEHAVRIWGRAPTLNDPIDRFCGSFKLFTADGEAMRHDECWMALALREGAGFNGQEIVVEQPSGKRLTVLAHANPIHDGRGALVGAVNVLVDISDRVEAENALKDADRTKNEFLATLAHELRNPLAPICNAVEILRLVPGSDGNAKVAVDIIERQTRQMTRLIDDLLDIARITANKLELRKEPTSVRQVLDVALETARPLIDAAGHQLSVSVPAEPIMLHADATRLAQVVSNLLNNAAKYTPQGGRIRVAVERRQDRLAIIVQDSGIGIPEEMGGEIFGMFTQVDRTRERTRSGLGLGLPLAKRLAQMHGGDVTMTSAGRGEGSEFVVTLPLESPAAGDAAPAGADSGVAIPHASLRILVVDDNKDAATSIAMLLRAMGNDVRTANDGLDALDAADAFQPQVFLLDLGLPLMSGNQLARRIRERPGGGDVTLIAVTGWGAARDRVETRNAGFDHHLVKPVDPMELMRLVATLRPPVPQNRPPLHLVQGGEA